MVLQMTILQLEHTYSLNTLEKIEQRDRDLDELAAKQVIACTHPNHLFLLPNLSRDQRIAMHRPCPRRGWSA